MLKPFQSCPKFLLQVRLYSTKGTRKNNGNSVGDPPNESQSKPPAKTPEKPAESGPSQILCPTSPVFQKPRTFNLDQYGLPLLNEKERGRRLEFATKVLTMIERDKSFLPSLVFSDEGNFKVFKDPSKRSKEKRFSESGNLPVIVWCGMTSKDVVGPFFFNSYVTESSYLRMLKSYMMPKLKELGYSLNQVWFQQDGAPPHRSKKVLKYLEKQFGARLISYGCPTFWPSKSQDLTPLDYFLWDHLKVKVANNYRPTSTEDMKECISLELENLDPDVQEAVVYDFRNRLQSCIEARGDRFVARNDYCQNHK